MKKQEMFLTIDRLTRENRNLQAENKDLLEKIQLYRRQFVVDDGR